MNYSNIKNFNQRQFNATMKRECITVSDYYDRTKTYDVFFRRSRRGSNPQGKVRIYFSQDTPIDIGTTFVLKDKPYVVTSRDGDESDVFYTSMAIKCDTSFTVFSNAENRYVSIPFVTLSDKYTLSSNSTISMVSGAVVIYTGDNLYSREVELDETYYNYGGYYKVGNTFYNNGLAYVYMTREAKPTEDKYVLTYNGVTSLDMKDATTYQLSYTAIKNGVPVDSPTLTYVSSDNTIATVDGNGLMTMIKQGNVTITATWTDGNNTTCETTIDIINSGVEPEPTVPSIKIYSASDSININGSKKFTVKFYNGETEITDTTIADLTRDDFVWTCSIDGVDVTNKMDLVTWGDSSSGVNAKRIKLAYDETYVGKYLVVTCVVNGMTASKSILIESIM